MSRLLTAALAAVSIHSAAAMAASDSDLAQIRDQIRQMREDYESRIRALERRLQDAETRAATAALPSATAAQPPAPSAPPPPPPPPAAYANAFNPAISLTLGGSYARLTQDPAQYRIQGFMPGGAEVGPGSRNFNLGESELTMSASIDYRFSGQMTLALSKDNEASVEEAFVRTQGLAHGVNVTFGRMLSGVGYLNNKHAHAWDFVDLPLIARG